MERKELYSKEKESYFNSMDWGQNAIEDMRNKGINIESIIKEREKDI